MKNIYTKKSAIVTYIGEHQSKEFTYGQEYKAFFLEYFQGKRTAMHAMGNSGTITHFNNFEDFEVLADCDDVLNLYEATVECITHIFDNELFGIKCNKQYKALGRDKDGMYLVVDESLDCYFYPAEFFEIIEDKHDLLSHRSIYYNCSE